MLNVEYRTSNQILIAANRRHIELHEEKNGCRYYILTTEFW